MHGAPCSLLTQRGPRYDKGIYLMTSPQCKEKTVTQNGSTFFQGGYVDVGMMWNGHFHQKLSTGFWLAIWTHGAIISCVHETTGCSVKFEAGRTHTCGEGNIEFYQEMIKGQTMNNLSWVSTCVHHYPTCGKQLKGGHCMLTITYIYNIYV